MCVVGEHACAPLFVSYGICVCMRPMWRMCVCVCVRACVCVCGGGMNEGEGKREEVSKGGGDGKKKKKLPCIEQYSSKDYHHFLT